MYFVYLAIVKKSPNDFITRAHLDVLWGRVILKDVPEQVGYLANQLTRLDSSPQFMKAVPDPGI
jgi:hypothetical protein